MCGIAGIIDLTGRRQPDPVVLQEMAPLALAPRTR